MNSELITAETVKRANRTLYDTVAGRYETVDGRRDGTLSRWIRQRLQALAVEHGNGLLVDLGSGSGVVTLAAQGLFAKTLAMDLSHGILSAAGPIATYRLTADVDALPLASESADVVSCFAVLHHLYDTGSMAREVARILRPGGAFWSDHDMDADFYRRFRWPLAAYRKLRGAGRRYADAGGELDEATYALAEYRENGVNSADVVRLLKEAGLDVSVSYHWFGLTPVTNRLFGRRSRGRGWGPLLRIVAVKRSGKGAT